MTASAENSPGSATDDGLENAPARGGLAAVVLGGGSEPDPRFTLANERTFLAWIRTALALLAGGVAVEAFTSGLFPAGTRTALALLLLVLAMIVASGAAVRWLRVERALRHRTPLPLPALVPALALGAVLAAGAVVIAFAVRMA